MNQKIRALLIPTIGVVLALYTLVEVNLALVEPQARLAIFAMLGIVVCFLHFPFAKRFKESPVSQTVDLVWAALSVVVFGYVIVQSDPVFKEYWSNGQSLGNRAGAETSTDVLMAYIGLAIVIEATRRSIGWALPILAMLFIAHAYYGELLPEWLLPHAQMKPDEIVTKTILQSLGVFGPALNVMFTYVFLFVIFGAFLEVTGATQFIVDFAERVFARSPGGPAKVSVLGSGLMGSLSGSAVANAVTTGTFTIPMMRNAGFQPHVAGGITAAAASGGALVPPVMGAGAYMMLEIIEPPVTFLQVAKAALIPAVLYYFSIFMIVHFYSRRIGVLEREDSGPQKTIMQLLMQFEGFVFFGALTSLIGFLAVGYSPFRAVTLALGVIILLALMRFTGDVITGRSRLNADVLRSAGRTTLNALTKSAKNGVSLVSASACVGIIIAIVQTTGIAGDFNVAIKGVVEESLLLALIGIMCCSLVLGMGVPSVVCYLLMATLMGGLLKELGVMPLAAHLFIFYFGMMSMVTPPVALAAFASASIAQANIMKTGLSAFLFSLVGFTLPFMFVYRPELLLLSNTPEIESVQVIEQTSGESILKGKLSFIGEPVAEAQIEVVRTNNDEATLLTTSSTGVFRWPATEGTWDISLLNPKELEAADQSDETVPDEDAVEESKTDDESLVVVQQTRTVEIIRERLGTVSFDPKAPKPVEGEDAEDLRIKFSDTRLSWMQVILGTIMAGLGIISLAAGIAGFLGRRLSTFVRVLAFTAAALMLYPGDGLRVAGLQIGYTDMAGLLVFFFVVMTGSKQPPTSAGGSQPAKS